MNKIVYRTETGIAVITPSGDYQEKIIDRNTPAVIENGKVVKPAIYEFHFEKRSGFDRAMKDIPKGAEYKIIDDSELPQDRTFRNAWNYDLKEDIPKAKEIWKEKLRRDREPLFAINDVLINDGLLYNDQEMIDRAKEEKERLKNIPQLVDSCKTIAAIKKVSV